MSDPGSVSDILYAACETTGWSFQTRADLMEEYIENQGDNAAFADFINEKVHQDLSGGCIP